MHAGLESKPSVQTNKQEMKQETKFGS